MKQTDQSGIVVRQQVVYVKPPPPVRVTLGLPGTGNAAFWEFVIGLAQPPARFFFDRVGSELAHSEGPSLIPA